jgi:outer membrane biogenesis lipoprotein LolB
MRQMLLALALLAVAVLSACTATIEPPKARIVVPSIATSPGFCPLGQAKKGNC